MRGPAHLVGRRRREWAQRRQKYFASQSNPRRQISGARSPNGNCAHHCHADLAPSARSCKVKRALFAATASGDAYIQQTCPRAQLDWSQIAVALTQEPPTPPARPPAHHSTTPTIHPNLSTTSNTDQAAALVAVVVVRARDLNESVDRRGSCSDLVCAAIRKLFRAKLFAIGIGANGLGIGFALPVAGRSGPPIGPLGAPGAV